MSFVDATALGRSDLENPAMLHGRRAFLPQKQMLIAPLFKIAYIKVFNIMGLKNVPNEELLVWYRAWQELRESPEMDDEGTQMLQVTNSYAQLTNSPKFAKAKSLKEEAPPLRGKRDISQLTTQDVKAWFAHGRRYCLIIRAHWTSFSRFMISKNTLHPAILEGIRRGVDEKQLQAQTAWTITTFLEQIVIDMLPTEERYEDLMENTIETHVQHIVGEHADIRHMRSRLDDDCWTLTRAHPHYKELKVQNQGYVPAEQQKFIHNLVMKQVTYTIITRAGYRADLQEYYGQKRTKIEEQSPLTIINDLDTLIDNKKLRREDEAVGSSRIASGASLRSSRKKKTSARNLGFPEDEPARLPNSSLKTKGNSRAQETQKAAVWPCLQCLKEPGSLTQQKKTCTQRRHCRQHGGRTKCTIDKECRLRLAKQEAKLKLAIKNRDLADSVQSVRASVSFLDEDIADIDVEDTNQPCTHYNECDQSVYGWHTYECNEHYYGSSGRHHGESWDDMLIRQEEADHAEDTDKDQEK